VLITPACHFDDVLAKGAGLVVEPTRIQVADGLRELAADHYRRARMGERARGMVDERFGWEKVARDFRDVCDDLVSGQFHSTAWRMR
jgi:glycosyltransferase involved in cell wall biosynthesis